MNKIYFVATPIGNLKDITFRAIDTLQNSDIIACEDPNKSNILLTHYGIKNKNIIKYNEGNKDNAVYKIIKSSKKNKIVSYIPEAGSPTISDPGYLLIREALKENIRIIPVPGSSALITALMVSGIPANKFIFMGFLPKKKSSIEEFLYEIKTYNLPVAIYVSPHRISIFLELFENIIPDRFLVIARELTKKYEEITRGYINEIKDNVKNNIRGEFTIIIDKNNNDQKDIKQKELIDKGRKLLKDYSISETSKILSKLYPEKRRNIYNLLHKFLKD